MRNSDTFVNTISVTVSGVLLHETSPAKTSRHMIIVLKFPKDAFISIRSLLHSFTKVKKFVTNVGLVSVYKENEQKFNYIWHYGTT